MKKLISLLTIIAMCLTLVNPTRTYASSYVSAESKSEEILKNVTCDSTETGDQIILELSNKNTVNIDLLIYVTYYNADQKQIAVKTDHIASLEAGSYAVKSFDNTEYSDGSKIQYKSFEVELFAVQTDAAGCSKRVSIDSVLYNYSNNEIVVMIRNSSNYDISNISCSFVYYLKGKIVGYESRALDKLNSWQLEIISVHDQYIYDDYKIVIGEAYR